MKPFLFHSYDWSYRDQDCFAGAPAAMLANTPQSSRPQAKAIKITRVEATLLLKLLKERFWMANSPIGGYQPEASRLVLKVHTDGGITGYGEGSDGANSRDRTFTGKTRSIMGCKQRLTKLRSTDPVGPKNT